MPALATLPKVHLHVHLESTLRSDTLAAFARDAGVDVPRPEPARPFAGFRDFADHNALVRECVRRPEQFERMAREFCADEAAQGTRYAEVTFTAASHGERLGDLAMPLEAVLAGLASGQREHAITVRVILDHSRRRSVERARTTLALALEYRDAGVIAIGAAGDESYSLEPFASVWDAARAQDMRLIHHAGETAGAASIREAMDLGHAERIGHGITVLEDSELVTELRERGIGVEVCPSSNVMLGLVASLAEHPIAAMRAAGLVVSINTDVPSTAGVTLTQEYERVMAQFGWSSHDAAELATNAVRTSFAPPDVKDQIAGAIDAWLVS